MSEDTRFVLEFNSPAIRCGELVEDVGLVRATGEFIPLLETGWDVPCHTVVGFATQSLEQNQITVAFHRRAPGPGDSRSLGEVVVALDDPADPEEIAIDLSLGVDDRSIWVSARTTAAGRALMVRWSKRADA